MAAERIALARGIEKRCVADARKGTEGKRLQCCHPRNQRLSALDSHRRRAKMRSRLQASTHRAIERAGNRAAHLHGGAGKAARELETKTKTFLPTPSAFGHADV